LAVIVWLLYQNFKKPKELVMHNPGTLRLGNPVPLQLKAPKPTRLLAKRIIVVTSGTPVQFPTGVVAGNEIRLNTRGNTGTVYL
jgi:hypothetical protein